MNVHPGDPLDSPERSAAQRGLMMLVIPKKVIGSRGGKASSNRNEVTNCAWTKKGRRMKRKPLARSWKIVTIKLTEPKSEDVIRKTIPPSHQVCPWVAMVESGGYEVQPEFAAPPGTKKLA